MRNKDQIVAEILEIGTQFRELQRLEDVAREPGKPFEQMYSELTVVKNRREYWAQERDKLFIELGTVVFFVEAVKAKPFPIEFLPVETTA